MSLAKRLNLGAALAVGLLGLTAAQAQAQRAPQTKEGASIVVDGVVREIFRSPRQTQTDYLVQIEVSRSEYGRSPADPRRVQAPAPGDQIYVHVSQANDNRSRPGGGGTQALPDERTQIRAYLYPRAQGGWEGAYPEWYDQLNASIASRGANDPEPPADVPLKPAPGSAPAGPAQADSILQKLGVKAEQVQVSGRLVFKVTEVVPGTPAEKAGIEPGDAIIGLNGGFITTLDQFAATLLQGGQATLAVLDVNSGKTAAVKVDMSGVASAGRPPAAADARSDPGTRAGARSRPGREDGSRPPRPAHDGPARDRGPAGQPGREGRHREGRRDRPGQWRAHGRRPAAQRRGPGQRPGPDLDRPRHPHRQGRPGPGRAGRRPEQRAAGHHPGPHPTDSGGGGRSLPARWASRPRPGPPTSCPSSRSSRSSRAAPPRRPASSRATRSWASTTRSSSPPTCSTRPSRTRATRSR